MTTTELIAALARECPNGVSFNPMAVRLLRHKLPLEEWQIKNLEARMFQLGNGLWFSREMILDDETWFALREQVTARLDEYGCFSVDRLFKDFCGHLRHIATVEQCAALLRHVGFTVAEWRNQSFFCFQPLTNLNDTLAAISETISGWLEEADGTLTLNEIETEMPHLTAETLEAIRAQLLPEVHTAEVGGMICWCCMEAIQLPDDFSEKVTTVVDTLVALEERVSVANVEFALNLLYRMRFREEYILNDNDTFMRVCAKHYQGENNVFSNVKNFRAKAKSGSTPGTRVRSPNTRFSKLGVPIGATLVFTKDPQISCVVLDDFNQVEYDGKAWSISALAIYLLGASSVNGFCHFSYEGEVLWDRRLRLERVDKQDEHQATKAPKPAKVLEVETEILGFEGRPLSRSTWRLFRSAGTNARVAEWARRVKNGENVENIASENGLSVSTVKQYIVNRERYFALCEKNGIKPNGGANV